MWCVTRLDCRIVLRCGLASRHSDIHTAMTTVTVGDGQLVIHHSAFETAISLMRTRSFPVAEIVSARLAPDAGSWPKGLKLVGAEVPGHRTVGVFRKGDEHILWDIHKGSNAVDIELRDSEYARIVIEVAQPQQLVAQVAQLIGADSADSADSAPS